MSEEREYPRAWGIYNSDCAQWCDPLCASQLNAEACSCEGDTVVELIPAPNVERLVREAVEKERERCVRCCESHGDVGEQIAERIRYQKGGA